MRSIEVTGLGAARVRGYDTARDDAPQAIPAATVNFPDLLGWTDREGTLAVGKLAGLIAVN